MNPGAFRHDSSPIFEHEGVDYQILVSGEIDCVFDESDGPAHAAMLAKESVLALCADADVRVGDQILILRPVRG